MKKKELVILCAILAFALALGGVVLAWVLRYRAQGISEIREMEGTYTFNGKLLLPEEGTTALRYLPYGNRVYEEVEQKSLDLGAFGFEGVDFPYYRVESTDDRGAVFVNYYPVDPAYEPFWPVCMGDRLVYVAEDGKKTRIHPDENLSYPIFADSVEGVDPYGTDVIAFSANASWAVALDGTAVKAYRTDPANDSLRVVEVDRYSLESYGTEVKFGAFLGNSTAWFTVTGKKGVTYLAIDFAAEEVAPSLLDKEGTYSEPVSRLFVQRLDPEEEKDAPTAVWCHVLLGEQKRGKLSENFEELTLLAVSPDGTYALFRAKGEAGEKTLVLTEKRSFALEDALKEGEELICVDFIYENVLLLTLKKADGTELSRLVKICF
ncbi:MAG: hypothetical protein IKC69_01190 [Clostridia bacterium]|nr:hypothetical protein [Clostridia bacterium]